MCSRWSHLSEQLRRDGGLGIEGKPTWMEEEQQPHMELLWVARGPVFQITFNNWEFTLIPLVHQVQPCCSASHVLCRNNGRLAAAGGFVSEEWGTQLFLMSGKGNEGRGTSSAG